MQEISLLISKIGETQNFFKNQAQRQVNVSLTLRNWLIDFYISEYELNGNDRAEYGKNLYKEIAKKCKNIAGLSERNLYRYSTFYKTCQNILRSPTAKLYSSDNQQDEILQSLTTKSLESKIGSDNSYFDKLINQLSFTHIVEFLKLSDSTKRAFYETESNKNESLVKYATTGLSQQIFVNKYLVSLPKEEDLKRIIDEEQNKF